MIGSSIGDPNAASQPDAKVVTRGTHRVQSFAKTYAAVSPHLSAMGITRVANVTGLDNVGIPVVMVCRPNARTVSVAQGKGLTVDAARVSGVMEAAEQFHAEEVELPLLHARRGEVSQVGSAVDVDALPLQRARPLAEERSTAWLEGDDLVSGEPRWVPYECIQLGRIRSEQRVFASTSTGLAAGNTRAEALSHAICESVERHALAIWHGLPAALKSATRVDLDGVTDDACRTLLDRCARAGVAVGVWNMTCEIAIPTFACYIATRRSSYARAIQPAAGYGCHPSRDVALARAITEAAQSRLTHIAGARDDMTEAQYTDLSRPEFVRRFVDFIDSGASDAFDAVPSCDRRQVSTDVAWELDQLNAASVREVVAVELTQGKIGIPVVRVTIPGLNIPGFRSALDLAGSGG